MRPNTRVLYVESPSNPLLRCVDLAAVAKLARERGVLSAIDNTFASPINQTPLELGIDAVVHSGTKYLNGHSDVNAGVVVSSREVIRKVTQCALSLGGMLDAHACTNWSAASKRWRCGCGSKTKTLAASPASSKAILPWNG